MATRKTVTVFLYLALVLVGASCTTEDAPPPTDPTVVEVTAIYNSENDQHLFVSDTDTVPSGWTTFRLINASPVVHFVFLDHLPGDRTSKELLSEISPIFQEASDLIAAGRPEEGQSKFSELPEWFNSLVFRGGTGFTSPGGTSEVTLYLEPGNYVLECYVKNAEGVYHWNLGMYKDLHVTSDTTSAEPPADPDINVRITDRGLAVDNEATAGTNLVAVHFEQDNPGLIGIDVHVAQITDNSAVEEVVTWMDFTQPQGLISTPEDPAPAIFLAGAHEMPKGNTAYFTVDLKPGEYMWISEQPARDSTYLGFRVLSESPD